MTYERKPRWRVKKEAVAAHDAQNDDGAERSEERRVGKEG